MHHSTGYSSRQAGDRDAPIRALLLDDNAYDRRRIQRFSGKSDLTIEIDEALTIEELSMKMDLQSFDVILLDYHLAEGTGLDALSVVQESPGNQSAAVIMISGESKSKVAVSAFRQGCTDFVAKDDLSPVMFQDTVLSAIENVRLMQSGYDREMMVRQMLISEIQTACSSVMQTAWFQRTLTDSLNEAVKSMSPKRLETRVKDDEGLLEDFGQVDEFVFKIQ